MNAIVTGSLSFDYIMDFGGRFADRIMPDKIHALSLSFLVDHLNKQFGGTAGNIAYTLKLLGVTPYIVAPAGNDFTEYRKFLSSHRIPVKYIPVRKDKKTSSYFVITDQADNQIGSFYTGAMRHAKEAHISAVKESAALVIIAPTDPVAMNAYVAESQKLHIPYLFDPAFQIATFTPQELREGITHARILIGNDYEIALIEKKLGISHEELIVMVPILVTTLGARGAVIETRHEAIHCRPAKPVNTSDPTGAGDAYRAGFVAGYLHGYDLKVCGQMGSVTAAYTVETYGTQTHAFTKKEFVQRYRNNFGGIIRL